MWKQKIGISLGNAYPIPTSEVVKIVAEAGFDAISPEWQKGVDLQPIVDRAKACGLHLQSLHAPFGLANHMWGQTDADAALGELLASLEVCRRYQFPVLVVHAWIGFDYSDKPTECGLFNFKKLVDKAREYGIQIAFENTEGEEFLFALMEYFKDDDSVGFCWDSGHEMCYNHSQPLLDRFGDKLLITHLNDNLGISRFDGRTFWTDDLHLLPFDGIADWNVNCERLRQARKLEYLNFELNIRSKPNRHENDVYMQMPLEQYFGEAYKRACRIAWAYSGK